MQKLMWIPSQIVHGKEKGGQYRERGEEQYMGSEKVGERGGKKKQKQKPPTTKKSNLLVCNGL